MLKATICSLTEPWSGRVSVQVVLALSFQGPEKKWATSIYTFHEACLPSLTRRAPLHHLPLALCSLTALPLHFTLAKPSTPVGTCLAAALGVFHPTSILQGNCLAAAIGACYPSSNLGGRYLESSSYSNPQLHCAWRRHRKGLLFISNVVFVW